MSLLLAVTHTNEDAAKKWCPFSWARSSHNDDHPLSGQSNLYELRSHQTCSQVVSGCHCLTTGCMAWVDDSNHEHGIAMGRCGFVTLPGI